MIKMTITYNDYSGVERTEDFYFSLSETEPAKMRMESLRIVTAQTELNQYLIDQIGSGAPRRSIKPKTPNCPNCGAPVDIHAEKCAYCDTPYM